jgi:hypothetical protein
MTALGKYAEWNFTGLGTPFPDRGSLPNSRNGLGNQPECI